MQFSVGQTGGVGGPGAGWLGAGSPPGAAACLVPARTAAAWHLVAVSSENCRLPAPWAVTVTAAAVCGLTVCCGGRGFQWDENALCMWSPSPQPRFRERHVLWSTCPVPQYCRGHQNKGTLGNCHSQEMPQDTGLLTQDTGTVGPTWHAGMEKGGGGTWEIGSRRRRQ